MEYLVFSGLFIISHIFAYYFAGAITYPLFYKRLHGGKDSLYGSFLRDMTDPAEKKRQGILLLPTQIARGLLMSLVLYPVLNYLGGLSFGLQFAFLAGLMFVYADLACAVPFSNTIEGIVYMKPRLIKEAFWKTQVEAVIYASIMGVAAGWYLF